MPQEKILVDTNAYLRLARSIRPLLHSPFGEEQYCLYIIPEVNLELKGIRFSNHFLWVEDEEYKNNRKIFPNISRKQKKLISESQAFMWEYAQSNLPGPSKTDVLFLAYGLELGFPVATDDQPMIELAEAFDINTLCSLEILRLMLDCGHIKIKAVESTIKYWEYSRDCPSNMSEDIKRLFPDM